MAGVAELVEEFGRRESLLAMLQEAPQAKCDLARALEVSRSTVDRAIATLESYGVVQRGQAGYELTLQGRLLFDEYQSFAERAAAITEARPAIEPLPTTAELDAAALVGATVTPATRAAPYAPADRHLELLTEASAAQMLVTAFSPRYVDDVSDAIDAGTTVQVGVVDQVGQRLLAEQDEPVAAALARDRVELRSLAAAPPVSLAVFDHPGGDRLGIVVYDEDGPRAYVENETPAAVAYARDYFQQYWREATPLSARADSPV